MFTIEVKKKGKDEEFSFEDIRKAAEVFHEECRSQYEGKVLWKKGMWGSVFGSDFGWIFRCVRCYEEIRIKQSKWREAEVKMIKTAIDGKERKLHGKIRVIQKT